MTGFRTTKNGRPLPSDVDHTPDRFSGHRRRTEPRSFERFMARENMWAKGDASKAAPVPFSFDGQLVRVVSRPDGDWFAATDAARILGYRDAANALRLLNSDERGTHKMSTPGGVQELLICSEPGLYKLIARSNRPKAREFDRFVRARFCLRFGALAATEVGSATTKLYTQAMNAASRMVGEVRRCQGPRSHRQSVARLSARASGIIIEPAKHPQGELALAEKPEPTEDEI